jgi:dihydroorotate dehydrogenase electron transfer subunit
MSINFEANQPAKQIKARVLSCAPVTSGVFLLWVKAPEIATDARPGQFAMLKCEGGAFLRRPLSIHRVSENKTDVAFLFATIGKGTAWLADSEPGDVLDILGPLGNGFDLFPSSREILLVAGGLGLAPLVFLAEKAGGEGIRVNLAYGTARNQRYARDLLPKGAMLVEFTDDGSCGRRGLVTECVPDFLNTVDQIFICGPLAMYSALAKQQSLAEKNVQVSLETRMACGLGICYACSIKTISGQKQVCHDGPVFRLDEVMWGEMQGV